MLNTEANKFDVAVNKVLFFLIRACVLFPFVAKVYNQHNVRVYSGVNVNMQHRMPLGCGKFVGQGTGTLRPRISRIEEGNLFRLLIE